MAKSFELSLHNFKFFWVTKGYFITFLFSKVLNLYHEYKNCLKKQTIIFIKPNSTLVFFSISILAAIIVPFAYFVFVCSPCGLKLEMVGWYRDGTSVPYGHIVVDLSPRTEDILRFCPNSESVPSKKIITRTFGNIESFGQ